MGHAETFGGDAYVIIFIMVAVSCMYKCVKTFQTVYFQYVQLIACQLYPSKGIF